MQVEWLRAALRNLDDEAAYIAEENPKAAHEFVLAILSGLEQVAAFPAMGKEGRVPGTREWVVSRWPYIVPYRIREGRLQVMRIFHTRRQPPKAW
ncbi:MULTISPECIES: type II toxin-antitoxin system RelE/ParE family toxin [Pseudomonas]|uniref:Type II toxin-antitoxin system mRNA interferase toxin, RelE/StbE family n=1 Tax=Pseudomonas lactis TaxID=1615674 RepID=A0ABS9FNB6_9PSED|nr:MULTISPECIES: type II toxin-antitoxin system RelE/ParE family toxin [Pseudomonas]MBI6977098.1 type II toxin-antitoxin system RelE/ParE family toxin [Pseudomonas lactis]MCF4974931.1 type II toxin-antitoxin system mRNA interferase toxin, RelE/StbE family [Pseudomonas lactis]MCF5001233.1 type II toxin-antitoxin system mRNA interferase toxin, RelE/StbE family [Pseudomonas lactis]MCF5006180.1 type II toxin-antitoxin system mRNA interferase toxin, RelE/StbE family [Pseudomonas lactis]MCF5012312.1